MDCSQPIYSVHGILQARILEWVAMASSRGSSWPRDETCVSYVSCFGRRVLYHQHHMGNEDPWSPPQTDAQYQGPLSPTTSQYSSGVPVSSPDNWISLFLSDDPKKMLFKLFSLMTWSLNRHQYLSLEDLSSRLRENRDGWIFVKYDFLKSQYLVWTNHLEVKWDKFSALKSKGHLLLLATRCPRWLRT